MYFIYNHQHVDAFRRQRYAPAPVRLRTIRAEREQIRRRIEAMRRPAKAA